MQSGSERRAGPRFEVFAQASVASGGGETYLMSVRNVSAAGVFLEGRSLEHPELIPGVAIDLVLSATTPDMGDDEVVNVRCRGLVARIEPGSAMQAGGFGVSLEPLTADDRAELERLMIRLAGQRFAARGRSAG
jgi:hypothetical protein